MIRVFILGTGKLAHHLVQAFKNTNVHLVGIYGRDELKVNAFHKQYGLDSFSSLAKIPDYCDVYFLAVSDHAIESISNQIKVKGLLVHCAGMLPISLLHAQAHVGVFWPIQSFSEHISVDFKSIPICIEANSDENQRILESLADKISRNVYLMNQDQRQCLHVAAVFVNNFTNHLYSLMADFLQTKKLPFDLLKPIILETAKKIIQHDPRLTQTGPASRKDETSMDLHKKILTEYPDLLNIYNVLSQSIFLLTEKK